MLNHNGKERKLMVLFLNISCKSSINQKPASTPSFRPDQMLVLTFFYLIRSWIYSSNSASIYEVFDDSCMRQ
jgi:hypothetical protein